MNVIGVDIGGANVKVANTTGRAATRPFAIWREPDRLTDVLREMLDPLGEFDQLAVTTTAELADCFRTKAEGVDHVLACCEEVAGGRPVAVWQTGAEFVSPNVARDIPLLVAAANWHALATWLGRIVPHGPALLVDVGSTTTDLVPLRDGVPVPEGLTDVERLVSGELLYSGVGRTPVFGVATTVPFRGTTCPLVPELFATMLDVHLLRGDTPEDPDDHNTANGRPATIPEARDRLARAFCCDRSEVTDPELDTIAETLSDAQQRTLVAAITRLTDATRFAAVMIAGSGAFLAERAVATSPLGSLPVTNVGGMFDPATASAACARAVAELATEAKLVW